jgi:hypothetical protein
MPAAIAGTRPNPSLIVGLILMLHSFRTTPNATISAQLTSKTKRVFRFSKAETSYLCAFILAKEGCLSNNFAERGYYHEIFTYYAAKAAVWLR